MNFNEMSIFVHVAYLKLFSSRFSGDLLARGHATAHFSGSETLSP